MPIPVIVDHVDIEKLEALATKSVHPSCTENYTLTHGKRREEQRVYGKQRTYR